MERNVHKREKDVSWPMAMTEIVHVYYFIKKAVLSLHKSKSERMKKNHYNTKCPGEIIYINTKRFISIVFGRCFA
jgi:hypothetical protein